MNQIPSLRPSIINSSSILISILYLAGLIDWSSCNSVKKHRHRGRPKVYSPAILLRCFIVRIWFIQTGFKQITAASFSLFGFSNNKRVMKACELLLSYLPNRHNFYRRLKTMSADIKERIVKRHDSRKKILINIESEVIHAAKELSMQEQKLNILIV